MMRWHGIVIRPALRGLVWLLVGASGRWKGCAPTVRQRVYFANHTSHIDTVALWSALPRALRDETRPVAARDYWEAGALRRYIAAKALRAVLIDRQRADAGANPLDPLVDALHAGDSLILFPEGARSASALPGPFKSGLFRLAQQFPDVEFVPVFLENLYRSMPKGSILPVPIGCTVWFGVPIVLRADETRDAFLERARQSIMEMA